MQLTEATEAPRSFTVQSLKPGTSKDFCDYTDNILRKHKRVDVIYSIVTFQGVSKQLPALSEENDITNPYSTELEFISSKFRKQNATF